MWEYAHNHLELSIVEQAHVASCTACQHLFTACVNAEDPEKVDPKNDDGKKRSA